MKVSIVMAYYNRKEQLKITLDSIKRSNHLDLEIIIVDDKSDEEQMLDGFIKDYNLNIKLIRIEDKKHINPCVPYNMGLREAQGEIIILQNPEVCHIGDVIKYVVDNLKNNDYMCFTCYGLSDLHENSKVDSLLRSGSYTELKKHILLKSDKIGGNSLFRNDVGGWLNSAQHCVGYHYLSAIYKDDLVKKMNYGFDIDYADGLCHDDDDFVRRIYKNNFNVKMPDFLKNDSPYGIHLWHEKPKCLFGRDKWKINNDIFKEKMERIGMTSCFPFFLEPTII